MPHKGVSSGTALDRRARNSRWRKLAGARGTRALDRMLVSRSVELCTVEWYTAAQFRGETFSKSWRPKALRAPGPSPQNVIRPPLAPTPTTIETARSFRASALPTRPTQRASARRSVGRPLRSPRPLVTSNEGFVIHSDSPPEGPCYRHFGKFFDVQMFDIVPFCELLRGSGVNCIKVPNLS